MKFILRLYVTGRTINSQNAIENLKAILDEPVLKGKYELEVIDILEHPKLAEDERILATPALDKKLPPPARRIIGDLSDREKVFSGLDLFPES
jgi:circadian clock protein KaiB